MTTRLIVSNHVGFYEIHAVVPSADMKLLLGGYIAKNVLDNQTGDKIALNLSKDGRVESVTAKSWGVTQRGAGWEDVLCEAKLNLKHIIQVTLDKIGVEMERANIYFSDDRTHMYITASQCRPAMVKHPSFTVEL